MSRKLSIIFLVGVLLPYFLVFFQACSDSDKRTFSNSPQSPLETPWSAETISANSPQLKVVAAPARESNLKSTYVEVQISHPSDEPLECKGDILMSSWGYTDGTFAIASVSIDLLPVQNCFNGDTYKRVFTVEEDNLVFAGLTFMLSVTDKAGNESTVTYHWKVQAL